MRVQLQILIFIIWLGLYCTVGLIVAPLLFQTLHKFQAGQIAGQLFNIVNFVSIICIVLLFFLNKNWLNNKKLLSKFLLLIALICVFLNQFLITPVIVALKEQRTNWLLDFSVIQSFSFWHTISHTLYFVTLILGTIYLFVFLKLNIR